MTTAKIASPLVTYETVAQACESLSAEGKRPSVRAIIAFLGGGSPNVVLDFQRQWKAGRPVVKSAEIQVDPRITQIVAEQIAQAVAAARADIEIQLTEAEQDAETVSKAGREAEDRAVALVQELEVAKGQVQALTGQIEQLKADAEQVKTDAAEKVKAAEERAVAGIAKAEEESTRERGAREAAQVALAKAELRLEALPRLEADLAAVRAELGTEREARIAAEQSVAVLTAKLDASQARVADLTERERVAVEKLTAATQTLERTQADLNQTRSQAQTLQATNDVLTRDMDAVRSSAADARTAAERTIEGLSGKLEAAQAEAKGAVAEAAELRGKLAKVEKPAKG